MKRLTAYLGTLLALLTLGLLSPQIASAQTASFTVSPFYTPVTVIGGVSAGPTVQFNNTSTGHPTSYSWTFGDGSTSPAQNPTHQYKTVGNFVVTLTLNNGSKYTLSSLVTCGEITSQTTSVYPYGAFSQYCGSSIEGDAGEMSGALDSMKSSAPNAFTQLGNYRSAVGGNPLTFYFFKSEAEQSTYFTQALAVSHPCPIGTGDSSETNYAGDCATYQGTNHPFTVVFQTYTANGSQVNNIAIQNSTAHETGHYLTWLYGSLLNNAGETASSSTWYGDWLSADWTNLNANTHSCPDTPSPVGLFYVQKDATNNYFCASSGTGPGLATMPNNYNQFTGQGNQNQQVLDFGNKGAGNPSWVYFFGTSAFSQEELFSEEVAVAVGLTDGVAGPQSIDHYIDSQATTNASFTFQCTLNVVRGLIIYGVVASHGGVAPNGYPLPAACPVN